METMYLDFIRQVIEQTLSEEHDKAPSKYFGGKNQVNLFSFYEQLQEDYEVDRYEEVYKDLVDQQNRTGLIMNGTIIAPESPQIMNTNSSLIVPMSFNCSFRTTKGDRDQAVATINNLMKVLKGRKKDVACFDKGQLLAVGTMGNNVLGSPLIKNGDYIGTISSLNVNTDINTIITALLALGFTKEETYPWYFAEDSITHKLLVVAYDSTNEQYAIVEEPSEYGVPTHTSFEKYKVSISFDSIRIDEPMTLNAEDYCTIIFSGSATLVDNKVALGNDLTKLGIAKKKVKADSDITCDGVVHWLEPLEIPSGLGISSEISQLASNNFIQNKHNDGINPSFDYSFVLDKDETLIKQLWKYARYGIQGEASSTYTTGVCPNMIYEIKEIWSSWGEVEVFTFYAKATENIDIENTESDALTIKLTFELQKE